MTRAKYVGVSILLMGSSLILFLHTGQKGVCQFPEAAPPTEATPLHDNTVAKVQRPKYWNKVDESGGREYLKKYAQVLFDNKTEGLPVADPNDPSTVTEWWQAAAMIDWFVNRPMQYNCRRRTRFGNWGACDDKVFHIKPPCLVYSFGIHWDYSFDEAMARRGCEVHSFDPSMGEADHKHNANVTFHNLGLGSTNTDAFVPEKDRYIKRRQVWKMRTLDAVKEMLGHQHRTLDVLKADIETHEWGVVDHMLETGAFHTVRQFLTELHLLPHAPPKEDYVYLYNTFRRMREYGMRSYRIRPILRNNVLSKELYRLQADCEFVNSNFLPEENAD